MSDSVAVDRRIVEDRQIDRSDERPSENTPVGVGDRHALSFGDRRYASRHEGERVLDPHRFSAKGECIRTQLRHRFLTIPIASRAHRRTQMYTQFTPRAENPSAK
jgi:hypothetical protein